MFVVNQESKKKMSWWDELKLHPVKNRAICFSFIKRFFAKYFKIISMFLFEKDFLSSCKLQNGKNLIYRKIKET